MKFKNIVFIALMQVFFANNIGACQEAQIKKITPQEMLFLGARAENEVDGLKLIHEALKNGADINIKNEFDRSNTALIYAARSLNTKIVKLLLDSGANPHTQNIFGDTALLVYIKRSKKKYEKEIVRLFLDAKADINISSKHNYTVLILAIRYGINDLVRLFLSLGADINYYYLDRSDGTEETNPLFESILYDNEEALKLLLDARVDLDFQDKYGNTALMGAIIRNKKKIVGLLLNAGADLNKKDNEKKTALDIALEKGNKEIIKMIKDEPKRRELKKEASKYIVSPLADIVCEYAIDFSK